MRNQLMIPALLAASVALAKQKIEQRDHEAVEDRSLLTSVALLALVVTAAITLVASRDRVRTPLCNRLFVVFICIMIPRNSWPLRSSYRS